MDSPTADDSQTTGDADKSEGDAYEAGYEAAKQVSIESVSEALDFSCGYFDRLRERLINKPRKIKVRFNESKPMPVRNHEDPSAPRSSHCSTALADSIRSMAVSVPDEIDEDPRKIVGAILLLIDEICMEGELEGQFDQWRDKVAESWCEVSGEHSWIHDHCGFWGHQYCRWCRAAKYLEIPGSCSECGDLMKITEAEYASR